MTRLGQILVRSDLVSENHLARALGVQHFAGTLAQQAGLGVPEEG